MRGASIVGLLLIATRAWSMFHNSVIDEVVASVGGDPTQQFVEIRMLSRGQNLINTNDTVIAAWDRNGNLIGNVAVCRP